MQREEKIKCEKHCFTIPIGTKNMNDWILCMLFLRAVEVEEQEKEER